MEPNGLGPGQFMAPDRRRRSLRLRWCLLLGIGVPLLVGCSPESSSLVSMNTSSRTAPRSGTSAAPSSTALVTVPPSDLLTTPMIDTVGGVDLFPPAADMSAVSADTARRGLEPIAGPLPPSYVAKLALLTDSQNATRDATGSYIPNYANRLVWAFVAQGKWSGSDSHLGAMGPDGKVITPQFPDGTTCTGVWLVDASTGEYVEGYSHCPASPLSSPSTGP